MAEFRMEIAGHTAEVSSLFESTPHYFQKYLTEKTPEFLIRVTPEDLAFEQAFALEEAKQEGFRPRIFPDPFLERSAIQRQFAEHLIGYDVLLVHGSAIAADGRGYLFTAKSGTGKSTHTRLWRQVLGERAVMINDDKPFLRFARDGIWICGSPWSGKHGLDSNISVPLQGICILERGSENRICPIGTADAMEMLRKQSCPPLGADLLPKFHALVDILAASVPLWRMECTKDPQAAHIAFAAMSAE